MFASITNVGGFIDGRQSLSYKKYYEAGIVITQDLLFNLNVADAYNHLSNKINKTNILQFYVGLFHHFYKIKIPFHQ